MATADDISDYWLSDAIPPNGRLPFELQVDSAQAISDFSLEAHAEPSPATLRDNFPVNNTLQTNDEDSYCLEGEVILGSPVMDYLQVMLTGFNADGAVVEFDGEYFNPPPNETLVDFSVCLDDSALLIDHYLLQTWGQ